jgi:plastocyanin
VLLVGLLGPGACSVDENESIATANVRMTDGLRFKPARLVVHAGDSVEWMNTSSVPHTVTADARRAAKGNTRVLAVVLHPRDARQITIPEPKK